MAFSKILDLIRKGDFAQAKADLLSVINEGNLQIKDVNTIKKYYDKSNSPYVAYILYKSQCCCGLRLEALDTVVKCSDDALDYITDIGYNKAMGARPLARAISTYLEQPLSIYLLEDKIVKGDYIRVELEDDELIFYKVVEDELIPVDNKEYAK